jgi:hypothetical protein
MKLMVTTGAFIAGAVIDDKTGIVAHCDHWLHQTRGMTEAQFRQYCAERNWAVGPVRE